MATLAELALAPNVAGSPPQGPVPLNPYGTPYTKPTTAGAPARNDRAYFDSLDEAGRKWWTENKMGNFYDVAAYRNTPEFFNSLSAADRQKWTDNKMGAYYKGLLSGDIAYGTMAPGGVDWNPEVRTTAGNAAGNWAAPSNSTDPQKEALFKAIASGNQAGLAAAYPGYTQEQLNSLINKYGHTDKTEFNNWYAANATKLNAPGSMTGGAPPAGSAPPTGSTPPPTGTTPPGAITAGNATATFNSLSEAQKREWVEGKWGAYYAAGGKAQFKPGGGPPPELTQTMLGQEIPKYVDPLYADPTADYEEAKPFDLYNDEGYQFRKKEGMDGIQNSAAAGGSLQSGNTLKELARFNSGLAADEYAAAYGRADNENKFNRSIFESDRGFGRGNFERDRSFTRGNFESDRGFGYGVGKDARDFDFAVGKDSRDYQTELDKWNKTFGYTTASGDRAFNADTLKALASMGLSATGNSGNLAAILANLLGQNGLTGAGAGANATVGGANNTNAFITQLLSLLSGNAATANANKP